MTTFDRLKPPGEQDQKPAVRIHEVDFDDPYVNLETFEDITSQVSELSDMGYYGDTSIDFERTRKGTIDRSNPATQELLHRLPSFSDWLDLVPTAGALDALYDPEKTNFVNGKPVDDKLREWLRNLSDARGIRSRAMVVSGLLQDQAARLDRPLRGVSLASGAALPIISTAAKIGHDSGNIPEFTLVDKDTKALRLAESYARDAGIADSVTTGNMNILRPDGLAYRETGNRLRDFSANAVAKALGRRRLQASAYDVVEVVGLTEYLKPEDWVYKYNKVIETKLPMAGAKTFLKNAFELVRPGGVLLVGNMLATHPQLGFTLNTIQWPHIQPRSIEQMAEIFYEAGISSDVDAYVPEDGVYAVYQLRKGVE